MEKPLEPNSEDCCNSGCNPCIFDIYQKQLIIYNKYLVNGKITQDNVSQDNGISQLKYTEFIVVKNLSICHLHNHIMFKRLNVDGKNISWKPGDHFLFKYSGPISSCTRAYTPVKAKNEQSEDYDFSIIVKKYDDGVVSTHLCNLDEGNITLWRGPYGHYQHELNKFNRIIMIAQGTGIVPFINIIENILDEEDDMTRVILLYCCKSANSILFRDELYGYKSYWNFKYNIFLSSTSDTDLKCKYQEPIKSCKLNKEDVCKLKPFLTNDQILLCGAPTFNDTYFSYLKTEVPKMENIILF